VTRRQSNNDIFVQFLTQRVYNLKVPTKGDKMTTFVVGFNKHNGKMGKRTIKARDREEAMDKCALRVPNSFWHFIKEIK